MNWLITGGCGFIGTSLVRRLTEEGDHFVRLVDNLSVGNREDLRSVCNFTETEASMIDSGAPGPGRNNDPGVELVVGDIRDEGLALRISKNMDVIVHLAANTGVAPSVEDPRLDCITNVIGTLNYLEAARHNGVGHFIFASSGAPIGECVPPIHEELPAHPVSPYGASKLAGEGYCSAYYRTFGVKTISLRFGNVYGARSKNKNSAVAKFFKRALNGEKLEIYGDGNQTRDFIYIDDLVQAIILASKLDQGGEIFQIATYRETTVNEIAQAIKAIVEAETNMKVDIEYGESRLGDVMRNYSDISKAKKILGFEPKYDLKSGLYRTFKYFMTEQAPEQGADCRR